MEGLTRNSARAAVRWSRVIHMKTRRRLAAAADGDPPCAAEFSPPPVAVAPLVKEAVPSRSGLC